MGGGGKGKADEEGEEGGRRGGDGEWTERG